MEKARPSGADDQGDCGEDGDPKEDVSRGLGEHR